MPRRSARSTPASLTDSRLVVVSGKGGVGKTTVAAAIAYAAAEAGKRVLIVEVEEREGLAPMFGRTHIGYEERAVAPNITALSVVPDEALVEYLALFYGIGRLAKPLLTGRAVEFATSTAPGLRDILLIGKVKEAESRRVGGTYVYDLVVLDAPPTGRLPRFLDAPRAVVDLVSSGAIRQQAQGVLDMLLNPARTRVVLVTIPEELPVQETLEGLEHMSQMQIATGPVIVNRLHSQPFTAAQQRVLARSGASALAEEALEAGLALSADASAALAEVASAHAQRAAAQTRAMKGLTALERPPIRLPALMTPNVGPQEAQRLAAELIAQGTIQ